MPQEEKPTLIELSAAHVLGFRPLTILHREPHYVRITRRKSGRTNIECLPADRLELISSRPSGSVLVRWWEDPFFTARLRMKISELCNSLDEPQVLRFDRKGTCNVGKAL